LSKALSNDECEISKMCYLCVDKTKTGKERRDQREPNVQANVLTSHTLNVQCVSNLKLRYPKSTGEEETTFRFLDCSCNFGGGEQVRGFVGLKLKQFMLGRSCVCLKRSW
jgi:hypothetical protein